MSDEGGAPPAPAEDEPLINQLVNTPRVELWLDNDVEAYLVRLADFFETKMQDEILGLMVDDKAPAFGSGSPPPTAQTLSDPVVPAFSRPAGIQKRDKTVEVDMYDLYEYAPSVAHWVSNSFQELDVFLTDSLVVAQRRVYDSTAAAWEAATEEERMVGGPFVYKNVAWKRLVDPANLTVQGNVKYNLDNPHAGVPFNQIEARNMTRVHARAVNLPPFETFCKPSLSDLNASDIDRLVQVGGTVTRVGEVKMMECKRYFRCKAAGCNWLTSMSANITNEIVDMPDPSTLMPCKRPTDGGLCGEIRNKSGKYEKGSPWDEVHSDFCDYQEIKIQESTSHLSVGAIPRSLTIVLMYDLAGKCTPGDQVTSVGILRARCGNLVENLRPETRMILDARSLSVNNGGEGEGVQGSLNMTVQNDLKKEFDEFWTDRSDEWQRREFIVNAVCPKLFGMQTLKLGLLLTLIGGVGEGEGGGSGDDNDAANKGPGSTNSDVLDMTGSEEEEGHGFAPVWSTEGDGASARTAKRPKSSSSIRKRSQSHMLMIGDPGTGKSQLLRFAAALSPRSVMTTGVGTTNAGLTCTAVREGGRGEWSLEAGALVLADRGMCAIDEFACMNPKDRTSILEAMEQQTLSVSKAGIVCSLNCRATILATCNPKHKVFDNDKPLTYNTGIEPPLLSRFDLIFVMLENKEAEDYEWRVDSVACHLLSAHVKGDMTFTRPMKRVKDGGEGVETEPLWSIEKLKGYLAIVKKSFTPLLSKEARSYLVKHYEQVRAANQGNDQVTVRFMESLIRLSQAHARLMYRDTVTEDDAIAVIVLMQSSVHRKGGMGVRFWEQDPNGLTETDCMDSTNNTVTFGDNLNLQWHRIMQAYGEPEQYARRYPGCENNEGDGGYKDDEDDRESQYSAARSELTDMSCLQKTQTQGPTLSIRSPEPQTSQNGGGQEGKLKKKKKKKKKRGREGSEEGEGRVLKTIQEPSDD